MRICTAGMVLAIATSFGTPLAEVRATKAGSGSGVVFLHPDLISAPTVWVPVLPPPHPLSLNVNGASNQDHSPAVALAVGTARPFVAWCEWDGHDYEIAISNFDGVSWSARELVTDNAVDDLAPSVSARTSGAIAVVWTAMQPTSRVQYRQREASGLWSPVVDVSDGARNASQPVVLAGGPHVRVAFVEIGDDDARRVKVSGGVEQFDPWPALFEGEVIAITMFDGELLPSLDPAPGGATSIWVDSASTIGFSRESGSGWSVPHFEPYAGAEDLARARIRARIRALNEF